MEEPARSRRSVLRTLTLSLLSGAALWRFLTPLSGARGRLPQAAARESDVPTDGALVLPEERVALVREGSDLVGLDLACTHLGCTVRGTPQGFVCPCHGSRFTREGSRCEGPAARPLKRLAVERADGVARVFRS